MIMSSCNEGNVIQDPSVSTNKSQSKIQYEDIEAMNPDGTINMIVEISAGTTGKYEMNKKSGQIELDSINGKPRYINYLGYPGNYGMIPNTILPKSEGGDGDPLDVLLLGVTQPRGSVQKVRIVGVMKLLDNGEQDDKILAVPITQKWSNVKTLADLDVYFPGSKVIISTFFTNYKTKGEMEFDRWAGDTEAMNIVNKAYEYSLVK